MVWRGSPMPSSSARSIDRAVRTHSSRTPPRPRSPKRSIRCRVGFPFRPMAKWTRPGSSPDCRGRRIRVMAMLRWARSGRWLLGHRAGDLLRNRAGVFKKVLRDAQHLVLGVIGVGHETAFEGMGATGDVGQQGSEQAAGAAFRRGDHDLLAAGGFQHLLDALVDVVRHVAGQGFRHLSYPSPGLVRWR